MFLECNMVDFRDTGSVFKFANLLEGILIVQNATKTFLKAIGLSSCIKN